MLIHEIQKLPDWFIELSLMVIAACVGRVINIIVKRLPAAILAEPNAEILASRSLSTAHKKLGWREHFPILHYFCKREKTAKPDKKIATYYFLLELVTILITLTVYQVMGMHIQTLYMIVFSWWLFALVIIDLNHYLLPDQLTLSLLWLGLLANLHGLFIPLEQAVCGAVFAYLLMWAIDSVYYLVRHRNGLGEGDWKLLAALAAWLGFVPALYVLAAAAIFGSIWGIVGFINKKFKLDMPLAFGPFLCLAAWLFVLCRPLLPVHM